MDLVVPINMAFQPLRASLDEQVLFARTQTRLNPSDYDGATYYFECVISTTGATPYNIELYDVTNSSVRASVSAGANIVSYVRYRSSSFTPTAGDSIYAVRIPQVDAALSVFSARIIIVQSNATKTRLQIPLIAGAYSSPNTDASGYPDSTTTLTSYGQTTPSRYYLFKKELSKLASLDSGSPWTFDSVMRTSSPTGTVSVGLFNASSSSDVTGVEVSHTGNSDITMKTIDFSNTADGFTDLDEFTPRIKTGNSGWFVCVYRACLYVRLVNLTKALVYTPILFAYSGTYSESSPFQKTYYDADRWSSGTEWYAEVCGVDTAASPVASVAVRYSNVDTGTGTGTLDQTMVLSGSRSRVRSQQLTLTDEYRYMGRIIAGTGTVSTSLENLIAEVDTTTGDLPTVTTKEITDITPTTAVGGGSVTNSGSSAVTAYGVCWNTTGTPTTADDHTDDS